MYTLLPTVANEVEIMAKPNRDNERECALRITKCSRQIYGSTSSHLEWATWKLFHYKSGVGAYLHRR